MIQRLPLVSIAAGLLLTASALAEPTPPAVRVSEAPLGKFGFYTGYGGPIWSFTIKRLVVQATKPGGRRSRPACARATRSWRSTA